MTKIHTPQVSPVAQTINENHQLRAQAERLKQSLAWEESTREQMAARLVTLYAELETEKAAQAQAVEDAERLRGELEQYKLADREYVQPIQAWAQSYLDAGRWAGHSLLDAIKTELLERDAENESLKRHYGEMEQEWDRLHEQLAIAELEIVRLQAKLKQADHEYGELFVNMADENENTLRLFQLANAAKWQAKRDARALEHIATEKRTKAVFIMQHEGLTIGNLDDPYQKLAFTFYTYLCEIQDVGAK